MSAGGLCDAVTTTPAAASSPVIDQASDRGRLDAGMDHRAHAERGEHAGRVEGEDVALAAGVVGDHHTASGGVGDRSRLLAVEQPLAEPGSGLAHHEAVHPHRTGSDGGAQTGGAELQPSGESLLQLLVVAAFGALDQVGQFDRDVRVRLVGQPEVSGSERIVSHC